MNSGTGRSTDLLATNSANHELDEILDFIAASTQLTETQRSQAETAYHAVGEWLDSPTSPIHRYRPEIFPQGSLALDTTNKPIWQNEFDLDLVCLMHAAHERYCPARVYDFLHKRIMDHGTYRKIASCMPRCIRLNYAGDFHLDIVPGVTDSKCKPGETCIFIPDRPLKEWRSSNPTGYVVWFDEQAARRMLVENYQRFSSQEKANVRPLREPDPIYLKPPLKIAIQLWKRWRDVAFKGRMSLAPSSIVLTTLGGQLYRGENHPTDALSTILRDTCAWADQEPIRLQNPANEQEWITDRWDDQPECYDAFVVAVNDFYVQWQKLLKCSNFLEMVKELKELFEVAPVDKALHRFAEKRQTALRNGSLAMNKETGRLGIYSPVVSAAPALQVVKKHSFHGE
jgi:hypothetical protein